MDSDHRINPGEPVGCVLPQSRGTIYADGGFDISPTSAEGIKLIDAGISYVDKFGIGWPSLWERPAD